MPQAEIGVRDLLARRELGVCLEHDAAFQHTAHARRDAEHPAEILFDDHQRGPTGKQRGERAVEIVDSEWREAERDFVEEQNSLGEYLASLASLTTTLPYDALVLPGHGVPFYGLKTRIKQLADHHEERCGLIADACREEPKTSAQLVPVVFHKHVLDPHQMGFAAGELIAHVNYMLVEGRLTSEEVDSVLQFRTT